MNKTEEELLMEEKPVHEYEKVPIDYDVTIEKLSDEELHLRKVISNNRPPSIILELDGVICYPNYEAKDYKTKYEDALPNKPLIRKLRELAAKEYVVVIYTSREMREQDGQINSIIDNIAQLTQDWLDDHGVPYHSLMFGRPLATSYWVTPNAITPDGLMEVVDDLPAFDPPEAVKEAYKRMQELYPNPEE